MSASAAARRSAYHHGDLHRTLLSAACDLMAETQSWDFSLRELARRAGVSHNAPYNHFADKGELLSALAADGFEQLAACTAAAAEAAPAPDEALIGIGMAYVRFGLSHPEQYRLMFGSACKSLGAHMPASATDAKAVLRAAVCRAAESRVLPVSPADSVGIEVAVLTAWSLVHGLTMLLLDGLTGDAATSPPPEAVAAAVLRQQFAQVRRK